MEADDVEVRSAGASSESYDGEPPAVRRRLALDGSFQATNQHRAGESAPAHRTSERKPATLPPAGDEDGSDDDELLLETTLTPQQDFDTALSIPDSSYDGVCTNSCGDFVGIGQGQGVGIDFGGGQEVEKFSSFTLLKPASIQASCQDGPQPWTQLHISAGDQATSQVHQQENDTTTRTGHEWTVYNKRGCRTNSEDGEKGSSETDLSCANSYSSESSSGFYGDIDEADYTGSLASSADLLETYDNAKDALKMELLREDDTVNIIGSCLEKVSSKVGHLQEIAKKVLSNYRESDNEVVEGKSIGHSSPEVTLHSTATRKHTPEGDMGHSAQDDCTFGSKNDTSSEDSGSCEQRFMDVKTYVLIVYSKYGRETGNSYVMVDPKSVMCEDVTERDAVTALRGRSISANEDTASTKVQCGTSEETIRSLVDSESTYGSNKEGYAKKLRNTCKSARTSRRIVTRQHGMMSQISAIAKHRVYKMNVACVTILNCVKGAVNVVRPALEAKRVARLCLQQATSRADNTVFEVAEAAIAASRYTKEALTFVERAVQLHGLAGQTLLGAKASLDAIQFEDAKGRDLSRQVFAFEDEIDKLIEQTSNISVEDLKDKRCVVESSTGTISFALKEVKQQSTAIENMTYKCDKALFDTIQALQRATKSSVRAIDAGLKALESLLVKS